jgi:hypothetical protein
MKNKHILDFRNYILEKLNNTMFNLRYNISYVELDFDNKDTFTIDDGDTVSLYFNGKNYYITEVYGFYGKYEKDITITIENEYDELYVQWKGSNGRSKVNIDDMGWVGINHIKQDEMHQITLAQNIVNIITYVDDYYKKNNIIKDVAIGEHKDTKF